MKKKVLAMMLCLCMAFVLLPTTAFAETTFSDGTIWYEVLTEPSGESVGTVKLKDILVEGELTSVNVATVTNAGKTYAVTSVEQKVFYGFDKLTAVSLPEVTSIGQSAFDGCTGLTTVNLPKVTSVGTRAFKMCTSLTAVSLPEATSIGELAFYRCASLTNVSLPVATRIESQAFNECTALTSVDLPKAVSIGGSAFNNCAGLTDVDLPEATSIGDGAFSCCTGLTTVSLPKATSIESDAFYGCDSLTSVTLWSPALTLGSNVFANATGCTVYMPNSIADANRTAIQPAAVEGLWAVSGTVYGMDGVPSADATVSVDGISVPTDANGAYTVYVKTNKTGATTITATVPFSDYDRSIAVWEIMRDVTEQHFFFGAVAPTFSPAGGHYTRSQRVKLSCVMPDAVIRYTVDGNDPTEAGTVYTKPIYITSTATIKANAFLEDVGYSAVAEATYTISAASGHDDDTPSTVTVYNDTAISNASMWLSGSGLSSSDQLVIKRSPQGTAYDALLDLAGSHRVFNTYDISLKSGAKSTAGAADLHFNLDAKYAGEDFTLVHQKGDGTYEYFYDAANANGGLDFGPLYELSPFMLVEGKLLGSPKTADGAQPALWLGMLLMASAGLAVSAVLRRKRQNG